MKQSGIPFQNEEMQQFFLTLPVYLQESIAQSGMKFTCEDDLRAFAENLTREGEE